MEGPQKPFVVVITGAAGNIGSTLLFMVLRESPFPPKRPLVVRLVDIPETRAKMEGLKLEAEDCCFPNDPCIEIWGEEAAAFAGAECLVLVGGKPRAPNSDRKDLLRDNARIFLKQGRLAREGPVSPDCRVLVVANPCNTNALLFAQTATSLPKSQVMAMTMLDHLRAKQAVAKKLSCPTAAVEGVVVWGNHSDSMFVDPSPFLQANPTVSLPEEWVFGELQSIVKGRGGQILKTKGSSSVQSAATAAWTHLHCWFQGSKGQLVSFGVITSAFGDELCVSVPVAVSETGEVRPQFHLTEKFGSKCRALWEETLRDLREEKGAAGEPTE